MSKRTIATAVQPGILRWARESLGLSVEDVATKMKRAPAEIQEWEAGKSYPSYPQLEKLAYKIYKRPLAVFFFPEPPQEEVHKKEFRTLPDTELASLTADTHLHIRKGHAYQLSLEETFEGRNPAARTIWRNLSLDMSKGIEAQAAQLRQYLDISLEQQQGWDSPETAFKHWRRALETFGVFVFKSSFKQKDISGFCLYHEEFPLIYLNNSNTATRQIFSLFHELTHLLLRINGISKEDSSDRLPAREKKVEQFANAVAAEFLIPRSHLASRIKSRGGPLESIPDATFAQIASVYSVSREAILRRLLDRGLVSRVFYEKKAQQWSAQKKKSTGGNYYATQGVYLSESFAREVFRKYESRQLSDIQAADLLGVKARNLEGIENRILEEARV